MDKHEKFIDRPHVLGTGIGSGESKLLGGSNSIAMVEQASFQMNGLGRGWLR